ncbi:MAG TPA: pyridoxal phosphate-dependent aminotransferase [Bryobacteraceae bacterium]|nr:pyridoxal phosphate-dependent aminotransferase [Bryobacteraceae bacterium]
MMRVFSSRLQWDSQPNPLSTLLAEKRRGGAAILDLTESNPTRAGLAYPGSELLAALTDLRALQYDPDPRGLLAAREAVAEYYAQRGMDVPVSRILLTASTSEAYSYLFKLLADPGDEILVPRPSYPLFDYLAAMESVRVIQYPLGYDGVWHIDFNALASAITPRTRAIVAVNPNNPTGSYLKRMEWERLQTFGLPILSDEVFSDFAFASDANRVTTLTGSSSTLTFAMSGLSKIAGLPQMKLGWIVAGGPDHATALAGLEWIADTFLSVATPVQWALPRILAASAAVQEQIRRQTRVNLDHLIERTSAPGSPCRCLHAEGGWYAILEVPRIRTEEEWALGLLAESDVLVQPGFFYDFEGEAFLVLSLLTPPAVFAEGLRRILDAAGRPS